MLLHSNPKSPNTQCLQCQKPFYALPSELAKGRDRFCSTACWYVWAREKAREEFASRFWAKVDKTENCWTWKSSKDAKGYGMAYCGEKNKKRRTHRIAWEITYGPIPAGLGVCHTCDNPPCCRPDHLFLGTQKDNMADAKSKGHAAKPKGRKRSAESIEKTAAWHRGKKRPPHVGEIIRALRLGTHLSDETKAKISAAGKGKVMSDETKAKIRATKAARGTSEETRLKLSLALKGKRKSAEHRQKLSIAYKKHLEAKACEQSA